MSIFIITAIIMLIISLIITVWASIYCLKLPHCGRRSDKSIILCGSVLCFMIVNSILTKQQEFTSGTKFMFDLTVVAVFEYAMISQLLRRSYVKHKKAAG